jgi:hypothetical protein
MNAVVADHAHRSLGLALHVVPAPHVGLAPLVVLVLLVIKINK